LLVLSFGPYLDRGVLFLIAEIRIRTLSGHHRVVDVAVFRHDPSDPVPEEAPLVAVEVVSPDEAHSVLTAKLAEYDQIGIPLSSAIASRPPGSSGRTTSTARSSRGRDGQVAGYEQLGVPDISFELPEYHARFAADEIFQSTMS